VPCWFRLVEFGVRAYFLLSMLSHTFYRTKAKLRSGEMAVTGDNWPIFLFNGYNYDPDDPWNGLFRSALLVSVRIGSPKYLA
jgi:hypothetical protein